MAAELAIIRPATPGKLKIPSDERIVVHLLQRGHPGTPAKASLHWAIKVGDRLRFAKLFDPTARPASNLSNWWRP